MPATESIESAGNAQIATGELGVDKGRHCGTRCERGTLDRRTALGLDRALVEPVLGVGAHGGEPWRVAGRADSVGAGSGVTGRRGDEHSCIRCEQEGDVIRSGGDAGATTDGVVDHIDTVSYGLVDRRRQVGGEASERAEALVGDDAGSWGNARDLAEIHAVHGSGHSGIASRGRSSVGAVAIVVTGRVELEGFGADEGTIGVQHLARADQLVVAGERRIIRVVGYVAELAVRTAVVKNRCSGIAAIVGETGVFRPDAGVDHADDHALAGDTTIVSTTLYGQAQVFGAVAGGRVAHHVG